MSTYAQVSDVRDLAPQIQINANTRPSEGQVGGFLNEFEAELNAILENLGYVTPVASTATASRLILKSLTAQAALAQVLRARGLGADQSQVEAAAQLERHVRERLKALKSAGDPFELPDAEKTDGAVPKSPDAIGGSFAEEGFEDFDEDTPRVTRAQMF